MADTRPGLASKDLRKLCPCVRGRFLQHLQVAVDRGIPIAVIETWRDLDRQRYYVSTGASQTMRSYHLPQPPHGLSLAYDIAPRAYLYMKGWNSGGELWQRLADIGLELGMEWGGNWTGFVDKSHYQLRACACDDALLPSLPATAEDA